MGSNVTLNFLKVTFVDFPVKKNLEVNWLLLSVCRAAAAAAAACIYIY